MEGQMNIFDYMDGIQGYHYCNGCENAKFKENTKNGSLYWCNIARAYITEHSTDWMCRKHGGMYERRKIR